MISSSGCESVAFAYSFAKSSSLMSSAASLGFGVLSVCFFEGRSAETSIGRIGRNALQCARSSWFILNSGITTDTTRLPALKPSASVALICAGPSTATVRRVVSMRIGSTSSSS
jgi:hypothetical protein